MSILLDDLSPDPQTRSFANPKVQPTPIERSDDEQIAVIGLGYVGLPLATHLAHRFNSVVGFDISLDRISQLQNGVDQTGEIDTDLLETSGLRISNCPAQLKGMSTYIVTVPTPITRSKQPDLEPLKAACRTIAPHLSEGNVVIFESTVYPGVTEEICGPLLADLSGLRLGVDFTLGYSPERINPGDRKNTLQNVIKVVAAQDSDTLNRISNIYQRIVPAGIYRSPSIKVAEGAKVLENTQRDVNIALMNEVSLICDKVGIRSKDVIETAATKWNFLKFEPGLVGGHCIGVDPYYLSSLADQLGLRSQVILAGRRINDGMVDHVVDQILRIAIETGQAVGTSRIGLFGLSFKEDVPDLRNSKSVSLVKRLWEFGLNPMVHDPHCSAKDAEAEGIVLTKFTKMANLDVMVVACPHRFYRQRTGFLKKLRPNGGLIDVKGAFASHAETKERPYWCL